MGERTRRRSLHERQDHNDTAATAGRALRKLQWELGRRCTGAGPCPRWQDRGSSGRDDVPMAQDAGQPRQSARHERLSTGYFATGQRRLQEEGKLVFPNSSVLGRCLFWGWHHVGGHCIVIFLPIGEEPRVVQMFSSMVSLRL